MVNKTLLVRMEIPIPVHPVIGTPSMIFASWLPLQEEEFVQIEEEEMALKFWFDRTCWDGRGEISELQRYANVTVYKIFADATIKNLPTELSDYIEYMGSSQIMPEPTELQEDYRNLAERILEFTFKYLNRLINYIRLTKDQFWLDEYRPNDEYRTVDWFARFNTKAKFDDADWLRWRPSIINKMSVVMQSKSKFINRDDWLKAQTFTKTNTRIHFQRIWELLNTARLLGAYGYNRSALIEAVTALELATVEFAKSPKADQIWDESLAKRLGIKHLSSYVESIDSSVSKITNYLFPILFTEEQLPLEILKGCQEAIAQRNNMIHRGQRTVERRQLGTFLNSIQQLCSILAEYSQA